MKTSAEIEKLAEAAESQYRSDPHWTDSLPKGHPWRTQSTGQTIAATLRELSAEVEGARELAFPIQRQLGEEVEPHPTEIPWAVADLAYSVYSNKYGRGQSLVRLAERGGFAPSEMDTFLPDWRDQCSTIASQRGEIERLENDASGVDDCFNRLRAENAELRERVAIDAEHLDRQRSWSAETFGPGQRLGVLRHIEKEIVEVEASPGDLEEWCDIIILAFDGAWRTGRSSIEIIEAIKAKQSKNESRKWPDWRTTTPGAAIEHDRSAKEGEHDDEQ